MRRARLALLLVFLLGGALGWRLISHEEPSPPASPALAIDALDSGPQHAPSVPEPSRPSSAGMALGPVVPSPPANPRPSSPSSGSKGAYMLELADGALRLIAQEKITGDFASRRGPPEAWSGMLRCRVLGASVGRRAGVRTGSALHRLGWLGGFLRRRAHRLCGAWSGGLPSASPAGVGPREPEHPSCRAA
jgi:hypothetical protein